MYVCMFSKANYQKHIFILVKAHFPLQYNLKSILKTSWTDAYLKTVINIGWKFFIKNVNIVFALILYYYLV